MACGENSVIAYLGKEAATLSCFLVPHHTRPGAIKAFYLQIGYIVFVKCDVSK